MMNVQIDDEQQHKFIRPIFEAMRNHVSDEQLIKIYFEVNLPLYSEYIPDHIMSDPAFIKEAIKRQLIDYNRVPDSLKNTDFITKEDYLHLVESRQVEIHGGLYPQDKDIVAKGIQGVFNKEVIEPQFRNDVELMAKCIKNDPRAWHYFDCQKELLQNKELVSELLVHDAEFYYQIPDEERKEKHILKAMLSNNKGYNLLNNFDTIRTITDPELVLDALKTNPSIKNIHQKFSTIIKKHDAKKDPYNFLKAYLMMNSLDKGLENKTHQPKSVKL
jgi:hypothetical protein